MTRLERLQSVLDEFQQTVNDYAEGEEEDLRPFFDGREECGRWVCVTVNYTSNGEPKYFFLPRFEDAEGAQDRAVEYAHDDMFEELPVAVVDLATGERLNADLRTVGWIKGRLV